MLPFQYSLFQRLLCKSLRVVSKILVLVAQVLVVHYSLPISAGLTACCSLDESKATPSTRHLAVIHSNGDVYWFPHMNFRTFCPLDLTHFPYDEHRCTIRLLSWTYTELEVNSTLFHY